MVTNEQIARINELSKKSKSVGLTADETKEQFELRQLYINQVKKNMKSVLDNTVIQNPDGSKKKLNHNPNATRKN